MKMLVNIFVSALSSHDYYLKIVPTVYKDQNGQARMHPFQYTYAYRVSNKLLIVISLVIHKLLCLFTVIFILVNLPVVFAESKISDEITNLPPRFSWRDINGIDYTT